MSTPSEALSELRSRGLILPRHPARAVEAAREAYPTYRNLQRTASDDLGRAELKLGRPISADNYDSREVQRILQSNAQHVRDFSMRRGGGVRTGRMRRESSEQTQARLYPKLSAVSGMGGMIGADVHNAIPRFYDPLEYWDLSGLPWNVQDEGHRHKLHKWLRLYYATHHLIGQLVDVFTRFPLMGMRMTGKDPALNDFYEDLFLGQLKYDQFMVDLGREFWVVGEAFPLGSFDEDMGIWEHEELINPEDVVIENFPLLNAQEMKIVPPDYLKRLAQLKDPAKEYRLLQMQFPDLIPYLLRGEHIPVSSVLLKQVANKLNHWDDRGTPILLRGLRTLLHEEKLLASQDAIAERLYSPLVLAKLGIQDMGDGLPPFIPGPEELESVRDDFDVALSSDFRLMVHHFGLEVTLPFGREQMPRLGDDFDRIEKRLFQIFGMNPSLLSAGSGGQPYASSALQAEFLNQVLKTFQNMLIEHYKQRAYVVAEAQGHYDYERKGKTRVPVYETIVKYDMDGNKQLIEVPKLLIPDLDFETFDMRDEATERQFLQEMRQLGIPIPDEDMMIGVHWDLVEKTKKYNDGLKTKTISQQQAKMDTYTALTLKGLPVPADLRAEVESVLQQSPAPGAMGSAPGGGGAPGGGLTPGVSGPGEPPAGGMGQGILMPPVPGGLGAGPGSVAPGGGPPPMSPMAPGPAGSVPQVSNERRPGLTYNTRVRTARVQGSALDDYMNDHDVDDEGYSMLGLPFQDFVADTLGDSPTYDEIDQVYHEHWGSVANQYREAVALEVAERMAALQDAEESGTIPEEEDIDATLTLKRNQELHVGSEDSESVEEDGEWIWEKRSKKRIVTELPEGKSKYSIVDPEAPDLPEKEPSESDDEQS